ncbi:MAG: hypothetical protein SAJ12_03730 [Jaaginema sp. PMC 1079.18]|nr:hypothetical protein [Jaaginema sp. PMC 1080.18]MEC4850099.1 hypothetical protein [Jaaginema sp. PMC 1079.18]MEC4864813.1 hypothetical protein [Jaaginema sp. PMC 1078.18]
MILNSPYLKMEIVQLVTGVMMGVYNDSEGLAVALTALAQQARKEAGMPALIEAENPMRMARMQAPNTIPPKTGDLFADGTLQ